MATQDQTTVTQVVRDVWAEMLPATPFDETLTWRDAGVDSLKSLHFLLRLEQVLGRPVSFDAITRDMTAGDLVRALTAPTEDPAGRTETTVYLIPGVVGDEPILAEFRRSLKGQVNFETLTLPDIDRPSRILASVEATSQILAKNIAERQPEGPLRVAGFSFGGLLAFQVGSDLIASGREVRLVCLLDALLGFDPKAAGVQLRPPPSGQAQFSKRKEEGLSLYVERLAYGVSRRIGLLEVARRIAMASAGRHDLETNLKRRRFLIERLRGRAMMFWRPKPMPAPTLLIVSDEFEKHSTVKSWRALCPDLTVERVPGGHLEIFEPRALAKLNPALIQALQRSAATPDALAA